MISDELIIAGITKFVSARHPQTCEMEENMKRDDAEILRKCKKYGDGDEGDRYDQR